MIVFLSYFKVYISDRVRFWYLMVIVGYRGLVKVESQLVGQYKVFFFVFYVKIVIGGYRNFFSIRGRIGFKVYYILNWQNEIFIVFCSKYNLQQKKERKKKKNFCSFSQVLVLFKFN